jgi:hypothetical protein
VSESLIERLPEVGMGKAYSATEFDLDNGAV